MKTIDRVIETEAIQPMILLLRGKRVIIDSDLARLYGVTTAALNQAVRRQAARFPGDFAFKLTKVEKMELITICDQFRKLKHSRSLPVAFTEHGAIMAACLLNSPKAVEVSVFVVRAFVRMRETLAATAEISAQLDELSQRVDDHDDAIERVIDTLGQLTPSEAGRRRRIGFRAEPEEDYRAAATCN